MKDPAAPAAWPARRIRTIGLLILLVAALLRLVDLGNAPPGLNQDEAANAWNAWCILHTGKDQTGRSFPLLYFRGFDENRSTLYMYLQIPFQAVGGLNPITTRLPSALVGVACVALAWYVGRRMLGQAAGLLAAGILAVNPWLLHLTRWGHEAVLCPLLALAGVACLLWMGLDFTGGPPRPRIVPAAVAGLVWGISTWAYPAARLFMPVFFLGILAVSWRTFFRYARGGGWKALLAFVLVGAAAFGPLLYMHVAHPEIMMVRLGQSAIYGPGDSFWQAAAKVAGRYPGHFGLDFLFRHGDTYKTQSPPGMGMFYWYLLPPLLLGVAAAVWRSRRRAAERILLVWLAFYPAGDLLSHHPSLHALRSSCGIGVFALLAALGGAWAGRWLWMRSRKALIGVAAVAAATVLVMNVRYLTDFFGESNRRPFIYHRYHVDLLEACQWLKPRLDEVDAVFCTTMELNMPYVVSLVGLEYSPQQWFDQERKIIHVSVWEAYSDYGKMHFVYGPPAQALLDALENNGRIDNVVFILRPSEAAAMKMPPPVKVIFNPQGRPVMMIYQARM